VWYEPLALDLKLNSDFEAMSKYLYLLLPLCIFNCTFVLAQKDAEIRKNYLQELILLQEKPASHDGFVSYHDSTWLDWVERTGELPPNFDALPSLPLLPDPLVLGEGKENIPITTMEQWEQQRAYFKHEVKKIFSGTFPDPPKDLKAHILDERTENGVKVQLIELKFNQDKAKLTFELFTPPGTGPFPVFMTQWNHRGWAQIAVRRGYMGLVYAGADAKDDTRQYLELYPEYDWSTLMTRAWGAHRAVDYLYTLDEVDRSKIAITGHSRNGKQSLFAAAFDDRITAVITSSGGTGGEFPYRYTDERHPNESIEFLVSRRTHWLHPRVRFYAGREHKLPIDQNSLMSLIAPNALLLSSSIREGGGGDPWAIEQNYNSLSKVYGFLGVPEKVGVRLRDGEHGVSERDIESYIDWLDIQFKRKDIPWENKLFYNYSFENWKSLNKEGFDINDFHISSTKTGLHEPIKNSESLYEKKAETEKMIRWILGEEPPGVPAADIQSLSNREDYVSSFINRPEVKNGKKENIAPYNAIGDYLYGSLYYPTNELGEKELAANGKMPVVIFLHKFSNTGYDDQLNGLFDQILSKGIAVLSMDLIGYGARIEEGTYFYNRYPRWSKMGKMVSDTRAAVDALESLDFIDADKIYLAGYSLGGTVGLFTAALEPRIAGTAVSSAFTPLRTASNHVEGIKAYSHLYGLIPKLGYFVRNENRIPVDFIEILGNISPRPLLIISPELDRHADHEQVLESMKEVQKIYGIKASDNLQFETPHEFNHFTQEQQKTLVQWLENQIRQ
jgi:cephalosporin-C deacetylase-like acetyl esterase